MKTLHTQVSTKGQIVIPAELREEMNIAAGTRFAIQRKGNCLILWPITPEFIRGLRGCTKNGASLGDIREQEHRKDRL
jgi:AbrB family looped-hinge helix DNA binding protein